MKKLYITSIFILSSLLTGCYTQLATRDYEREDFGINEGEAYLVDSEYYDTLLTEVDTAYYDTVYVDEDGEIYDNLYADYPTSQSVDYPEIIYVGGGYYPTNWDYWYYPRFSYYPWYSYYPGCLVPGYGPNWYPGYCGIGLYYYGGYYDPYYHGGNYGYAVSDPKYKYRTNNTHDSRLRDNDGGRSTTRTRDGLGGRGYVGRTASIDNGRTSVNSPRIIDVDKEIGKSRGSSEVARNTKNDALKGNSRIAGTLIASRNTGTKDSRKILVVRSQTKKTSIKNKSYKGSGSKVNTRSKSGSSSRISSDSKIYRPKKNTSKGSRSLGRVYKGDSKSSKRSTSSKSYKSKRKNTSSKSYSAPRSRGRSSSSKSYSSPSRGSSSRSSYSPRSGSSSRSSGSRSGGSRSGGSRSGGRSSGKSVR